MKQVYLDNAATTPVRLEVEGAMRPYFCEKYGNPSGVYQMSSENRGMIENVREQIAKTLNASAEEIYFTSGGTESDNWAIKAAAQMLKEKGRVGMVNTCLRIRMMTEDTAQFSVESEPGIGTLVSIRFPLNKATRAE